MYNSYEPRPRGKWVYFDQPKLLALFDYKNLNQTTYSFENIIPKSQNVKEIKLLLFLRTGSQANTTFWTKTKVLNGNQEFVHWTYGHRFPQIAISYNSQTINVPCERTRQIIVKTNHVQDSNCHLMQYFVTGYFEVESNNQGFDAHYAQYPEIGQKQGTNQGWGHHNQFQGFVPAENQTYKFICGAGQQFALDCSQNPNDMNNLIIWSDSNAANQKFTFKSAGNGKYGIFCAKNGLAIELSSKDKGSRVRCGKPDKQQNKFWELVPATDKKYHGKNAFVLKGCTGHVLDVHGGQAKNEAHIGSWDAHGGDNQVWIIKPTY